MKQPHPPGAGRSSLPGKYQTNILRLRKTSVEQGWGKLQETPIARTDFSLNQLKPLRISE